MNNKYVIKVKNILGKNKEIVLLNGEKYTLKDKDEKIIGYYSKDADTLIFKLLKTGFEVSKILEENIQEHMKIESVLEITQTVSSDNIKDSNKTNTIIEEKPKKKERKTS